MRLFQAALTLSLLQVACNSSSGTIAEQDPQRAQGAVVMASAGEPSKPLAVGPLFLTDVLLDGYPGETSAGEIATSGDAACKEPDAGALFDWYFASDAPIRAESHHGMRLFIPAGKTLCFHAAIGKTKLVWAAYRP